MSRLRVCRMCLSIDGVMFSIANSPLQQVYEIMTRKKFQSGDGKPMMACHICRYMLLKCQTFMNKLLRADYLLQQVLDHGLQVTCETIIGLGPTSLRMPLKTTPVYVINLEPVFMPIFEETDDEADCDEVVADDSEEVRFKVPIISNVKSESVMFMPTTAEEECILPEITSVTSLQDEIHDVDEYKIKTESPGDPYSEENLSEEHYLDIQMDHENETIENGPVTFEDSQNVCTDSVPRGASSLTVRGSPLVCTSVTAVQDDGSFVRTPTMRGAWESPDVKPTKVTSDSSKVSCDKKTVGDCKFFCECGKAFMYKSSLLKHARTHEKGDDDEAKRPRIAHSLTS